MECAEDPIVKFEGQVQRTLRELKKNNRFTETEYNDIYPSSSRPGRFYATAKRHKVPAECNDVNQLPLRPIVTNIGTATYGVSKYLAKLLHPLSVSPYTVTSTQDFVNKIKDQEVPQGYTITSFDVTSLFTNVPLEHTIEIILRKIYQEKLVKTKLKRHEMKKLLDLCTKELHFSFNGKIYKQIDGVVMGNPLGPVIANIFMVELECTLVPTMSDILVNWYCYVDDIIVFVKDDQINKVLEELQKYHKDIKFTHEVEDNRMIPFLDVLICRKENNRLRLKVYRKKTCSNIYIHWNSFAPASWKIGTLEGIIRRAYMICTDETDLKEELSFVFEVFKSINGYPERIIDQSQSKMKTKFARQESTEENVNENEEVNEETDNEKEAQPFIVVPYAGERGEKIMKKLRNQLPEKVKPRIVYNGTKLSSFFQLKDKVPEEYCSNVVYYYNSQSEENTDYTGETKCRIGKRHKDHQGADPKSAIVINFRKKGLPPPKSEEFTLLARNYSNRLKKRIAESLLIKEKNPTLNVQQDCYKLTLFNCLQISDNLINITECDI